MTCHHCQKRRYANSAMSLVERNISNGMFKTLKAAALIVFEVEIDNEQAQLHVLSEDSGTDEDNINNIFYHLYKDDGCIDALINRCAHLDELQ